METKTYEKEKVDRIFKMIDSEGFIALFNQELKTAWQNNEKLTKTEAFYRLNEEYFSYTGKLRYNSFESFKIVLYHK